MAKLYSDEQIIRAKETSLEDYLRSRGETLKRAGSEYVWIYRDGSGQHDSVTVKGSKWYDHKNQQGGDTIGFLQEFMGYSFRDAVENLLNGEQGNMIINTSNKYGVSSVADRNFKAHEPPPIEKDFILPEPAANMRKLFAYLIKSRFIDASVVQHFVNEKSLYQEKAHDNIVFLGKDESGEIRSGSKKSVNTFVKDGFKGTISGSSSEHGFGHKGERDKLFVFEAPIDLMSYLTIFPEKWKEQSYIALDGLSSKAMFCFLENNPQIDEVNICIDHDEAGIEAFDKFKDMLIEKGYATEKINRVMPVYKDWNEMLKAGAGMPYKPPQEHPRIEAYKDNIERLCELCGQSNNSYIKWRSEQYAQNGLQSVSVALNNEYQKFKDSIEYGKITKIKSGNVNEHLLRMADLCIMTFVELKAGEQKNINKTATYKETAICMCSDYKPYTDKGKLRNRCSELEQSFEALKKSLLYNKEKEMLSAILLRFARNCIQAKVYIDTKYASDLTQQQAMLERNGYAGSLQTEVPQTEESNEMAMSM